MKLNDLNLHPFYHTVEFLDETTSTNDILKSKAHKLKEGYVVIADSQSKGKGRNGRSFYSPKNCGIYLSFLIRPSFSIYETAKVSACVGVAVYEAIKKVYHLESKIKWINDIYLNDKKIAGILCESSLKMNSSHLEYMIIGIGINVHQCDMSEELQSIAASIEDFTELNISRSILISEILNRFYDYYQNFESCDFMSVYRQHSYVLNKKINVLQHHISYAATVCDIDDQGALIVQDENGIKKILTSGEISIRIV